MPETGPDLPASLANHRGFRLVSAGPGLEPERLLKVTDFGLDLNSSANLSVSMAEFGRLLSPRSRHAEYALEARLPAEWVSAVAFALKMG